MTDTPDTDAVSALDRFFEELRREVRANPDLAHRLVKALGAEVTFESGLAAKLVNPLELVATQGEQKLRATLSGMPIGDVKAVLKAHNLASPVDMKGLKHDALIDLAVERAATKAKERQS